MIAALTAIGLWTGPWLTGVPKDFAILLQATINVGAIAVGFLATAKGILISVHDREIVQRLQKTGQLRPLVDYFIAATFWCLVLCILSAWLLVLDLTAIHGVTRIVLVAWISILLGSSAACFRVIFLFNCILRTLAK